MLSLALFTISLSYSLFVVFIIFIDSKYNNEFDSDLPQFPMLHKIEQLCLGRQQWTDTAIACKKKSESFAIQKTADGFLSQNKNKCLLTVPTVRYLSTVRLLLSFVLAGINHKLKLDKSFSERRNQGSLL